MHIVFPIGVLCMKRLCDARGNLPFLNAVNELEFMLSLFVPGGLSSCNYFLVATRFPCLIIKFHSCVLDVEGVGGYQL